jgi:hypothetical protein
MTTYTNRTLEANKFAIKSKVADYVRKEPNKAEKVDIQVGDHSQ